MEVLLKSVRLRYLPNVGKGGFIIGGAAGNGAVYERSELVGFAKLSQLSIGFQAGAQAYREVVFLSPKMIWSDSKIVKSNLRLRFRQSPQQPGLRQM
jgi:lipid-binding SYLF domain-containing protein